MDKKRNKKLAEEQIKKKGRIIRLSAHLGGFYVIVSLQQPDSSSLDLLRSTEAGTSPAHIKRGLAVLLPTCQL